MTSKNLANFKNSHESERLKLETLTPQNMSDEYVSWLQDPEIIQYLEVRHAQQTQETVTSFVQDMLESENNLMLGIFTKTDNKHIGNIKIGPINWRYGRADIGIIIGDKNAWGKGYATETIQSICDIAFKTLELTRLQAGAYASNAGSLKAFKKAGFKQEGILKAYWKLENNPEDQVLLGKTT